MMACFLSKLSRLFSKEALNSENVRPPSFIIYLDKTLSTILNNTSPQRLWWVCSPFPFHKLICIQLSVLRQVTQSLAKPSISALESDLCGGRTLMQPQVQTPRERVDLLNKSFIEMVWYFVTYESYKQNMWVIFSKHSVKIKLDQRSHSIHTVYECRGNKRGTMEDLHTSGSLCVNGRAFT